MVPLLLEQALGNEHREIDVFMAGPLELRVQAVLDILPNGVAVGAVNEHALDAGVVDELRLPADVGEPLGEVHLHIGDLLHLFLILCHRFSILYR